MRRIAVLIFLIMRSIVAQTEYPGSQISILGEGITTGSISITDPGTVTDLNIKITYDGSTGTALDQLSMSVISPSGTPMTLFGWSTLTGSLYQTLFDDEAIGLISDGTSPYLGTYQPQTSLSVFDGEAITGTWTFVIDNRQGYTGTVEWSLNLDSDLSTPRDPPDYGTEYPGTQVPIPGEGVIVGTINITDLGTVTDLNIRITYDGSTSTALDQISMSLTSPLGTAVTLFGWSTLSGYLYQSLLDDEASGLVSSGTSPYLGTYQPQTSLSVFDGEAITGTWSLVINNSQGYTGTVDWALWINPPDVAAPLPPTGPAAIPADQEITLDWTPNSEPDLAKYRIHRDTYSPALTLIDSVVGSPPDTVYLDMGLINGQTYYYRITAIDTAGNESGYSTEVSTISGLIVISSFPAQNALNVPLDSPISVTFGMDMNPTTFNANTFAVHGSYTGKLSGTYAYDSGTKTATFTPTSPFKVGEQVSISLTTGITSAVGDTLVSPYSWEFTAEVLGGSGVFTDGQQYGVGSNPRSIASADLESDGDLDLVIVNSSSNSLSVFLGHGNGTFLTKTDYATGLNPQALTIADVDGDGHLDIMVANSDASDMTVSVLLAYGDGTYQNRIDYATGGETFAVTAADFNGDGRLDLATVACCPVPSISILLNIGGGMFAPHVEYGVGPDAKHVVSNDLDGDGDYDLVAGGRVLINSGDGQFSSESSLPGGPYAVADIDGDGDTDIVLANTMANTVSVLRGNGGGTFTTDTDYNTGIELSSISLTDLNGDKNVDLLVSGNSANNSVGVLLGFGDGAFGSMLEFAVGGNPISVISTDLDGDGDADLAAVNIWDNNFSVLLNRDRTADIAISADTLSFSSTKIGATDSLSLIIHNNGADSTLQVSSITSSNTVFTAIPSTFSVSPGDSATVTVTFTPADMVTYTDSLTITSNDPQNPTTKVYLTGIGDPIVSVSPSQNALNVPLDATISVTFGLDMNPATINANTFVVHGNYTGKLSGTYTYDSGARTATFAPDDSYKVGEQISVTVTTGVQTPVGDGLGNAYAWDFTAVVQGGSGIYAAAVNYGVGNSPQSVTAADLDGDGDTDLAVANRSDNNISVLLNTGSGVYANPVNYGVGSVPYSVTAADLDGDKDTDLVVANGDNISVLLNNGFGIYAAAVNYTAGSWAYSVTAADLDGDGDTDLAVANRYDNNVSVLLNTGSGTYANPVNYGVGSFPSSVTAADLDGDGDADLAVANVSDANVSVLLNNGSGTYTNPVSYAVGYQPYSVTTADLDGDGDADLAVANHVSNTVSVLLNNGSGIYAAAVNYGVGSGPYSVTAADLDGDGDTDLAVASRADTAVSVILNNGSGSYATAVSYRVGGDPWFVIAADLDGDGDADLAVANSGSGNVSVLLNSNAFGISLRLARLDEYSDLITVPFRVSNPSGTATDLTIEYSPDEGLTWLTPGLSTIYGDTSALSGDRYIGEFQWDSYADLPGVDLPSVRLRVTPHDTDSTGRTYTTGAFHLDNNRIPTATVPSLNGEEYKEDITISYSLADTESDTLSILAEYSLDGAEWQVATVVGVITGITTYSGSLTWNSLTDLPLGVGTVDFRITPSDNDLGVSDMVSFSLDNIGVAIISITSSIDGEVSGNIPIDYQINDDELDPVSILAERSVDGVIWQAASVSGDTTALATANYSGTLVWDSRADLPGIDNQTVRVKLTPYDVHIGFADMTDPFHLDNNNPPTISIQSLPDTLAIKADIGYAITDDEGDTVSIDISYSTDISTWNTANANAESIIINPDQYNGSFAWDVLSDVGFQQLIDVQLRFVVADNDSGDAVIESGVTILNYPADYNGDLVIDFDDLSIFVTQRNSEPQVLVYEIGPATGTVPDLTVNPDGVIDFEDLVVFAQMWNWSFDHNGFAKSMPTLAKTLTSSPSISLVQRVPDNLYRWDGQIYLDLMLETDEPIMMVDGTIGDGTTRLITRQMETGPYWDNQYGESLILSRTSPDSTQMVLAVVGFDPKQNETDKDGELLTMLVEPDHTNQLVSFAYNLRGNDGAVVESGIIDIAVDDFLPEQYVLHQNYPNPFNPTTTIRFDLPQEQRVGLMIYDIMGREVVRLVNEVRSAGYHEIRWSGRDIVGRQVASGIYFVRLVTPEYSKVRKMLLLK